VYDAFPLGPVAPPAPRRAELPRGTILPGNPCLSATSGAGPAEAAVDADP